MFWGGIYLNFALYMHQDGPLLEACEQGLSGHEPKSIICNTRLAEDPCDASSPVADGYSVHSDPDYGVLLEGMQSSEDLLENLKDHTCSTLAAPELGISMPEGSSCLYGSLATGSARLRQLVAETRGHSSFSADTAAAAVAAARKPARAVVGYPILPSPGVPHDSRGALMPENAFDRKASSHENASSTDSDAEQYSDIPYEALPSDDEGRFYQPLLAPSPNLKTAENILDDICSTRGEMPDIQPGKGDGMGFVPGSKATFSDFACAPELIMIYLRSSYRRRCSYLRASDPAYSADKWLSA